MAAPVRRRGLAVVLAALVLPSCATRGGSEPEDAGSDASTCRAGQCDFEGACILPTVCHPLYPGLTCAGGEWLSTCGNGVCDCGERPDACGQDCECEGDTCADGPLCVAPETCNSDGTTTLCRAGGWVSSCGDGTCNCGETLQSCVRDCPPDEPFWSECVARTGQYANCATYCATVELRCVDSCRTSRGLNNWGMEGWTEGDDCQGNGTSQGLCDDAWGDRVGAAPHWRCCCGP